MDTVVPNNPYVGPRSIKTGEAFFGRDREIRSLSALLIAERIVLLHSPSGAGKSSLIQAGLIPRMSERFSVLPLVRVNLEAPEDVRGVAGLNRYVLSTLLSLEEGLPPEKRLPLPELAVLTLDAYLEQRASLTPDTSTPDTSNCLLLFDQFEEILTVSPTDAPVKQAFFEQLGEALQNRRRWALFAIREDYMGGLAPYVRAIPNRLNVPFRLGLLGPEAAKTAIQQPAKNKEVDFTDEAAAKLVDDLRRIQVQQPDGSFVTEAGPNVEPVQLQVVCFNLWQSHAADDKIIDENDLQRVGNVDQALASYYANAMRSVAESAKVDERILRQWFDEHLITPEGIRSQVLKGAEASEGLPNIVLRLLEDTHLVRGETRAGKTWYELSHDRLVQPVRQDNSAWFEHNLTILQRQAVLWDQQGRSEGMLLRRRSLDEAEREVSGIQLTPDEQAFLDACRVLRKREQQDIRQRQFIIAGLITSLIFLALSVTGFFRASQQTQSAQTAEARSNQNAAAAQTSQANTEIEKQNAEKQRQIAEEQARVARAEELSLRANTAREKEANFAMLLGIEAFRLKDNSHTRAALQDAVLYQPNLQQYLFGHTNAVTDVAISPDGKIIASASYEKVIVWNAMTGKPIGEPLYGSGYEYVAFNPDGTILAISGDNRSIILWDVNTLTPIAQPIAPPEEHTANGMYALEFSPDGKLLASGNYVSASDDITIWNMQTQESLEIAIIEGFYVHADDIAFSPDGKTIAAHTSDGTVTLWDTQTGKSIGKPFIGDASASIAFSPDGKTIASSSNIWDLETQQPIGKLTGASDIAFTPDGKTLVSSDGDITLWDVSISLKTGMVTFQPVEQPLAAGNSRCIAISSDGKTLVSGNEDGTVTLWHLQPYFPIGKPLTGDLENISGVNVISPDGKTLALVQQDSQTILLWDIAGQHQIGQLLSGYDIRHMAFSPDGRLLATNGSDDKSVIFWDLKTGQPVGQPLVSEDWVSAMVFSPDSKQIALSGNSARLWSVETRQIIKDLSDDKLFQPYGFEKQEERVQSLLAQGNGKSVAYFAVSETLIMLWQTTVGSEILSGIVGKPPAGGGMGRSFSCIFNPDGTLIAFIYNNPLEGSAVFLWDLQKDKYTKLPNDFGSVAGLAFSPDGRTLVTAGEQIVFWDTQSWKPVGLTITEKTNGFYNPVLSPDGTVLAAMDGESIMLWDVRSRQPLVQPIPAYSTTTLMFNPADNGKTIVSTGGYYIQGSHAAVILWDLDPQFWIAKVCERVGRNFTYAEWEKILPGVDYRITCANWPVHPTVATGIMEQVFSNIDLSQKAKTALDKVAGLLKSDTTVKDPISESKQLVDNFVLEKLMQGSKTIDTETIKSMMALVDDANYLGLSIDPVIPNNICWRGGIEGYAQEVLPLCERAVSLAPNEDIYRDSRGLVRALTGDFAGASLDFQFYVDGQTKNGNGQSDQVKQRRQWILDLKAGKNPFTPEILEMLKGQ